MAIGQEWYEDVSRHGEWRMDKREDFKWEFSESAVLRYVEQSDSRPLELATQYIKTLTSFENPKVEGVDIDGTFVTKAVWWGKVQDFNGQDAFRLYHLMVDEAVSGGDSARIIEKGCRYNVTYTFYYRQSSIITPTQSTSGVSYKIIGITRDPDTGLFSYILEKRERIVQTIPEYEVSDDEFKRVTQQEFNGVRDGDLDEDNNPVPVWSQSSFSAGTLIETKRTKNEDCTHNIIQSKTVSYKNVERTKITSVQGLFTLDSEETLAVDEPLSDVLVQTAGTFRRHTNVKRIDDLYDVTEYIETGEPLLLQYEVSSFNGAVTVCRWWNYTKADQDSLINSLTDATNNSVTLGGMNRFALYDGSYVARASDGSGSSIITFVKTGVEYYSNPRIVVVDGVRKVLKYKYTATYALGYDVQSGLTAYSGALGDSFFQKIGSNFYYYRKVTAIESVETDYTGSGMSIG